MYIDNSKFSIKKIEDNNISMFIQTETTPNPNSLKFLPGRVVMENGTSDFSNAKEAINSLLAQNLFKIEGVKRIFFGSDFISVTKIDIMDWQILKPSILGTIANHYESGATIIDKVESPVEDISNNEDSEIVTQIKELLDTRVRPAVASDGGDIVFNKFKDGVVYLHMQGACSGCPSSTATLKTGIENMLKHYIPEIKEVQSVTE